jgi:pimeloyl-ACP methyl ester carboxylesterase
MTELGVTEHPDGQIRQLRAADGLPICVHEFGHGRPIVVSHPMGYNAPAMAPFVRRLDGLHAYALDHRGHGGTRVPEGYRFSATCLADDLLGCVRSIADAEGPVIGFGHSMGAAAMVLAEAMAPGSFERLYLYEPAIIPPHLGGRLTRESPNIAGMLRRRAAFASLEAVRERYGAVAPFRDFVPDAFDGYIEHGFVPEPDGSVRLACLPEHEVAVSVSGMATLAFERLVEIRCPAVVFRGTSPEKQGRAGHEVEIAAALPFGELVYLEDLNHFGPQQRPEVVAEAVLKTL